MIQPLLRYSQLAEGVGNVSRTAIACSCSGITGIPKPIPPFFQLEPSTDMPPSVSTAPPAPTTPPGTDPQASPLRLSPEELKICKKWIVPYSILETTEDRLKMLRGAILPRLAKVNTGMPEEVWKPRKSVSIHPHHRVK